MSKVKTPANESQSYQAMLSELDEIVRNVGQGQLDLDEIVSKIEHGYKLISTMRERLDATKSRVEKLRVDFERNETTLPAHKASPTSSKDSSKRTKNMEKELEKDAKATAAADDEDSSDDDDDMPF
jgi:exodeoxyribonuclease VII small subunit